MSWHKIILPDGEQADALLEAIREEFAKAWNGLCAPRGIRVYVSRSAPAAVYFSPDAGRIGMKILEKYRALPCAEPESKGLEPLIGHPGDL